MKYNKGQKVNYLGHEAVIKAIRPNNKYKVKYISNKGNLIAADYVHENTITF